MAKIQTCKSLLRRSRRVNVEDNDIKALRWAPSSGDKRLSAK